MYVTIFICSFERKGPGKLKGFLGSVIAHPFVYILNNFPRRKNCQLQPNFILNLLGLAGRKVV